MKLVLRRVKKQCGKRRTCRLPAFPHKTVVETMDSLERGINPVTINIINLRKEYLPGHGSNQSSIVWKRVKMPEPSKELWLL